MKLIKLIGTGVVAAGVSSGAIAADYQVRVTNLTSGIYFTPLIVATHDDSVAMFRSGTRASEQLQAIAEGGDVSGMASLLESIGASVATGAGLLAPSATEEFTVSGNPGDVLSVAGMLLPTNDGFVGLNSVRLPSSGSSSYNANGYDAGTEGNDEVVGSGAPGQPGFPAPPPVVASGTGTGATGIHVDAEGYVHIHRNVIGDFDGNGGISDINAAVHRWLNPVARITVTALGGGNTDASVTAVSDLSGIAYSSSALEIFWQPASTSEGYITGYEIRRNGNVVATIDGLSFFEEGLNADTDYTYTVTAMNSNGDRGAEASVNVRTNP